MKNINSTRLLNLALLFFTPQLIFAQDATAAVVQPEAGFYEILTSLTTIIIALTVLGAIVAVVRAFDVMVRMREVEIFNEHGLEAYKAQHEANMNSTWWQRFSRQMTGAIPLERESELLLDHDYDGIKELDNNLPPWWLYGFYLTIGIAIVYMGVNHFSSLGMSSAEQYEAEMATAKAEVEAYVAKQANSVDETNVTLLTDELSLTAGKDIFTANCVACHLESGGGSPNSVGPNLTDEYWLHGGGIKNVFKTIKNGVPTKGMIAWKTQMPPSDIHKVASYVLSLQGSNPANPKAPQGEKYVEVEETTSAPEGETAETTTEEN